MKLKALLINPWIYDFAAYNLWSMPLGLLKAAEYMSQFDVELSFIDCTDAVEIKKYGSGRFRAEVVKKPDLLKNIPRNYKQYGLSDNEFVEKLKSRLPADFVLITSVMSYWYPGAQKAIDMIRGIAGSIPVVLGGIYATLYSEHALNNSGADFIYRGNVSESLNFALNTFGFRLKRKRSPLPYYRLNLYDNLRFAPLLTSSGCPFKCAYCASRYLNETYRRRPAGDVAGEIRDLYDLGIRDYVFYDDALLFDPDNHIKPALQSISAPVTDIRFHAPNGLHARYIDGKLAQLMKAVNFRTIRLGFETIDETRQRGTGGKVASKELECAVMTLKQYGFKKEEIGVYLMYGLPGQELKEVREGIRFLKSVGTSIYLAEFSPIRHTLLWDELAESGVVDDDLDPLLTNNTVFSYLYSGYDPEEITEIKLDVKKYNSI